MSESKDLQPPYEKPVVDSYSEKELEASVEAVGTPSIGGGPP